MILDTAAGLFATQGFTKTTISQISSSCRASKAWIYHYFPTKEDILFTLLRDFLIQVRDRIETATSGGGPAREILNRFVLECLRIYDDYRINYPILFAEMTFLPEAQQKELRAIEDGPVKVLEQALIELRPDLGEAKMLRTPVTLLVYGTVNWTYTWFNPDGKLKTGELASLISDFVMSGLTGLKLERGKDPA